MSAMQHKYDFQELLADLHLGRATEAERQALEAQLREDVALAEEHLRYSAAFQALSSLRGEPIPAGLEERIAARVRAAGPPRFVVRRGEELDTGQAYTIRMHNFRDIAAVAAMIVLAVGVGVPGLLHLRERNQRMICADNLAQVGRGLQTYAMTSGGSLPFVGWDGHSSWQPSGDPGVVVRPNRQHLYVLVKQGYVAPEGLVCPASDGVPMASDGLGRFDDFPETRNLSYAYQNMAGVRPSLSSNPAMPILSDDNPLFDGGWFRGLSSAPPNQNSRGHGGAGQNLLTIGGRSIWATTPNSGVNGDNIWLIERRSDYTGREGPESSTDSHLIK